MQRNEGEENREERNEGCRKNKSSHSRGAIQMKAKVVKNKDTKVNYNELKLLYQCICKSDDERCFISHNMYLNQFINKFC